jgi:hypothetical protein
VLRAPIEARAMIAGLSSSLALAQRTAAKARVTMDTMSRQIATGQKVASVKDDGAAWARAAAMKSDKATVAGRDVTLARLEAGLAFSEATNSRVIAALERLEQLVVTARGTVAGSSQRAALQAEWDAVTEWTRGIALNEPFATITGIQDLGGPNVGYDLGAADSFFSGGLWAIHQATFGDGYMTSAGGTWPFTAPRGFDLLNAGTAQLNDITSSLNNYVADARWRWPTAVGDDQNRLDRLKALNRATEDRLDAAIGSLTDADLGKASTARAQAETRQQLALDTVRNAINAYGAFAGGLLANAQRTQRSVLA